MKISVAQIKPLKGDIEKNIAHHKRFIERAANGEAEMIFFPELSLTGYEPGLAKVLAIDVNDSRLNDLQQLSNGKHISIGVGMPTKSASGVLISMILFQPTQPREIYSKQFLHEDELPYFSNGQGQIIWTQKNINVAPAICYESLLHEHAENAYHLGAQVYVASVAKSNKGIDKALKHFPVIARKYAMPVLMTNSIGPCDNFESAGTSSVWNKKGSLIAQLSDEEEGVLIFDTDTEEVTIKTI